MNNCTIFGHKYVMYIMPIKRFKNVIYMKCEKCFENPPIKVLKKFISEIKELEE